MEGNDGEVKLMDIEKEIRETKTKIESKEQKIEEKEQKIEEKEQKIEGLLLAEQRGGKDAEVIATLKDSINRLEKDKEDLRNDKNRLYDQLEALRPKRQKQGDDGECQYLFCFVVIFSVRSIVVSITPL